MVDGDLYSVLGVRRDASAGEIKQAYRHLARVLHPDHNGSDAAAAERFRRVSYAYEVLSDAAQRAIYDRYGEEGLGGATGGRPGAPPVGSPGAAGARRAEVGPSAGVGRTRVSEFFGGGRGGAASRRGGDLTCTAALDIAEAVRGCVREVRIKGSETASDRVVRVRIPPGVRTGERLRVPGLGRQGSRGGDPGDLWLVIRLRSHPHFFVEGGELHLRVPVTPLEAYDGASVEIPTPYGPAQVRVPARSQSGTKLRVRSRGLRRGREEAGDLILHLRVVLPTADGLGAVYGELDSAIGPGVRDGLRFD